jgi:hypothetical protein
MEEKKEELACHLWRSSREGTRGVCYVAFWSRLEGDSPMNRDERRTRRLIRRSHNSRSTFVAIYCGKTPTPS